MTNLNAEQKTLKGLNSNAMENFNQFLASLDDKKQAVWNEIFKNRQATATGKI